MPSTRSYGYLVPPGDLDALKAYWHALPVWDLEYAPGFEDQAEELATWHQAEVQARAAAMGCSPLMASIVEELARCWIDGSAPTSPLAVRVLRAFS